MMESKRVDIQTRQVRAGRAETVRAVAEIRKAARLKRLIFKHPESEVVSFKSFPPPQKTSVLKHVRRIGIQSPVIPFTWVTRFPWHFYETVVERKIVSDGVLPSWEFLSVVREAMADEVTDLAEGQTLFGALEDGHGDQGDVRIGRFHRRALARG